MRLTKSIHHLQTVAAVLFLGLSAWQARPENPVRPADEDVKDATLRQTPNLSPNKNMLFNGWGVTPAGEAVNISDMPLKMVIAPDKKVLVAVSGGFNDTGLSLLDLESRTVKQFIPLPEVWNGLAFSGDGKRIFVSGGDSGKIYVFNYENETATAAGTVTPSPGTSDVFLAGIAVNPKTGEVYVCNEGGNEVWALNENTLALDAVVPVGEHPHSCVLGADHRHLYVSNWGARSVSVVDTQSNRRVRDIEVGLRPNDMALAPDGRLFVACSGDNTVHVIQTRGLERQVPGASPSRRLPEVTREIISTSLYEESPEGSTPDGVAVSPDGKTLFVANADNNDVLVVDISDALSDDARRNGESVSVINGFIPVGWYPTAVLVSPDNQTLLVANGKGLASRPNYPPTTDRPVKLVRPPGFDYIPRLFQGSVSFISRPNPAQMAKYTEQVRLNSPYTPNELRQAPIPSHSIIPDQVGQPCPIKYVLYIIKENRTYD